mgnify:CR=1 FL=1
MVTAATTGSRIYRSGGVTKWNQEKSAQADITQELRPEITRPQAQKPPNPHLRLVVVVLHI